MALKFRTVRCALGLGAALILTVVPADAQFTGHYPPGVEGVKGGTLPPPGVYLRNYNIGYWADDLEVGGLPPSFDFEISALVFAPRLVWITNAKLFGGYYGADILIPFGFVDWEQGVKGAPGHSDDDYFGLGDIFVEPVTISWHGDRFDAGVGYGFWAASGDFDRDRPPVFGKGFWSHMLTAGGTWYPDAGKKWSFSLLNRYEFHHEHEDFDITPGQTLTMEWGLSRAVTETVEVGIAGYYQQQTTDDDGPGAGDVKDHVVALGPEVNVAIAKWGLFASLRYNHEFEAKDRPKGETFTLTLTKRF
jgi:hypothetical protein